MMYVILTMYAYSSYRLPRNETHRETTRTSENRTRNVLVLVWTAAIGIHANSRLQ